MNKKELKNRLEKAFQDQEWNVKWNQSKDVFEIKIEVQQNPFQVSIPHLLQRMKKEEKEVDKVISEIVNQVQIMINSVQTREAVGLIGQDRKIYPVMRSTSFPTDTSNGKKMIYDEHTAETRIYYALDLEQSYTLIDESLLQDSTWSKQELKEKALFNLRGLENTWKQDVVAGNYFYFISPTDGYGASRILNQSLIQEFAQKAEGDFCLATPHQDVLVLADLRNSTGYDILGQMVLHFYTSGAMPITPLPFDLKAGKLEPIFILAKRKPKA